VVTSTVDVGDVVSVVFSAGCSVEGTSAFASILGDCPQLVCVMIMPEAAKRLMPPIRKNELLFMV
jgi:hypothetical protein